MTTPTNRSGPTIRPAARPGQARIMRIVNVPMRAVLGLPFPTPLGSGLMLVRLTGRRTGRHYRQPVSYTRDGNALLTPGGGNWKLNLVDGQPVGLRLQGHELTALPEVVGDLHRVEDLLGRLASGNPRAARFIPIPRDTTGRFDRAGVESAVQHGFRMVRWHPADARSARAMKIPLTADPANPSF